MNHPPPLVHGIKNDPWTKTLIDRGSSIFNSSYDWRIKLALVNFMYSITLLDGFKSDPNAIKVQ